jgi:hypothetical protein
VTEVVILGRGSVSADASIPRERPGELDALLTAERPRAAIVADEGEACFFRASFAFERGVSRVVLKPGSVPEAWLSELAARARELGGELFLRHDTRYERVRADRAPVRVEVGAPSSFDVKLDARFAPLPLAPRRDLRCEEIAFTRGLKPVLYLVVDARAVEQTRARYSAHPIVAMDDRLATEPRSGERSYGVGDAVVHLFIGARASEAAEAWKDGSSRNVATLGALMGYPDCCVRAFAAMASRSVNAAFPYVTAARTRAFGDRFHPLLDATRDRLVPFVPCSYGCRRAVAWAAVVAEGLAIEPAPALFVDETRAFVFAEAEATGEVVRYRGARFVGAADDPLRRALDESGEVAGIGVFLPFDAMLDT